MGVDPQGSAMSEILGLQPPDAFHPRVSPVTRRGDAGQQRTGVPTPHSCPLTAKCIKHEDAAAVGDYDIYTGR